MRNKLIVIFITLFVAVILISIFLTARQELAGVAPPQEEPVSLSSIPSEGLSPFPSLGSGITVIKPAAGRQKSIAPKEEKSQTVQDNAQAALTPPEPEEDEAGAATSGITRFKKMPSKKEMEEMQSRGIIIY